MDTVFRIANSVALAAWLPLLAALFLPRLRPLADLLAGRIVPALLAALYVALLVGWWGRAEGGGFGSPAEVAALFAVPGLLVAGWTHYLAFDLFVGAWIARDGVGRGLSPWLLAPCLAMTFLAGPAGFLVYLVLRGLLPARTAQP